jgi:hypothetical protein
MTTVEQVNFKINPKLKSAFMSAAKHYYKMPASVLFSRFMEMVAERNFEFRIPADNERSPELEAAAQQARAEFAAGETTSLAQLMLEE